LLVDANIYIDPIWSISGISRLKFPPQIFLEKLKVFFM
jgi:hypothetical protein